MFVNIGFLNFGKGVLMFYRFDGRKFEKKS